LIKKEKKLATNWKIEATSRSKRIRKVACIYMLHC
jgi:hypothetical protein